jgi:hypothetical protein
MQVVGDEQHGPPLVAELGHLAQAARLELRVARREHLVDHRDVRLEVGGHREGEPEVHPRRVALDRRVEKPLDPRELDDLVEAPADVHAAHPQERPVDLDVLPPGQLRVERRADLEQCPDAPPGPGPSLGRIGDPREQLEQRALARAVAPDDADPVALLDRQGHVAQRPELLSRAAAPAPQQRPRERFGDRVVHVGLVAEQVALSEPLGFDDVHQTRSAKRRSVRRK